MRESSYCHNCGMRKAEIAKLREENRELRARLATYEKNEGRRCANASRQAKIEALEEAREQLSQDCIDVTKKYQNSKDPHERVNGGWASYAHGFLRCRLDIMIEQLKERQ